jgi:hypothetical protein
MVQKKEKILFYLRQIRLKKFFFGVSWFYSFAKGRGFCSLFMTMMLLLLLGCFKKV